MSVPRKFATLPGSTYVLIVIPAALLFLYGPDGWRSYYAYELLFGDRIHWAEEVRFWPETGDCAQATSTAEGAYKVPDRHGHWEMVADFQWEADAGFADPAVYVNVMGAYELYWDGVRLAANGKVGVDRADEIPGFYHVVHRLPREAASAGKHRLRLHLSNYHVVRMDLQPVQLVVGEQRDLIRNPLRLTAWTYLLAGMFLLCGCFYTTSYVVDAGRSDVLVFGSMALALCALALLEYGKYIFDYAYHLHFHRMEAIAWLTIAIALLLPTFCSKCFGLSPWPVAGVALAVVWTKLQGWDYDLSAWLHMAVGLSISWAQAMTAVLARMPGSRETAFGLTACFAMVVAYDVTLFLGFAVLILAMMRALAVRWAERTKREQIARLRNSRLELELLRKQLQPHFLMNTLTSLIAWIEDQPDQAVEMIEALAEELAMLNHMSKCTLVPLSEEIELCRAHLKVLAFRHEQQFHLSADGDETVLVPPAVCHTLVENGLTHMEPDDHGLNFELESRSGRNEAHITFTAYGLLPATESAPVAGTGTRYIEARLEEAFGDGWRMDAGPVAGGWQTRIQLDCKGA